MIPLYESEPFYGGIALPHKHAGVSSEATPRRPQPRFHHHDTKQNADRKRPAFCFDGGP
jgi:hypothetical protein